MGGAVARWRQLVRGLVDGRDVILAGAPLAGFWRRVEHLREAGARRVLCIANGLGTGPVPEGDDVVSLLVDLGAAGIIEEFRAWERLFADPPQDVADALDRFDPRHDALVLLLPFQAAQSVAGRPAFGGRRPEWVALEDKTTCDALFDRAGVPRPPSTIVPATADALQHAARDLDQGDGTVWAGDASRGFNGGGEYVRWLRDAGDGDIDAAAHFFAEHCDAVRVAPFLEGIPSSIHGLVCNDGVAALRPVELVTLRPPSGNRFRYAGAATFWDPPPRDRDAMRDAAQRVGALLRDEVDYRGAFTIDGVLAANGWVPTELNPRFGAGLGYGYGALPDVPLDLLHHLVIEGDRSVRAADLEAVILPAADRVRWGGGWTTVPQR